MTTTGGSAPGRRPGVKGPTSSHAAPACSGSGGATNTTGRPRPSAACVHPRSAPPFDMENPRGDASFREIPGDVAASQLMITHDYYDHAAADRDVNTVFPLERLRELAPLGVRVAPRHFGFMGHVLDAERERLTRETAPEIGRASCRE